MKRGFIRRTVSLLVVSSLFLGLVGCGQATGGSTNSGGKAVSEVKIGAILPLSGDSAPQGLQSRRANELAVDEINANGGIKSLGGAKIKLVFSDSQSKPQVAVSEAERLLSQENVAFILGAYNSGVTLAASEVTERYKKIWWSPVSSDQSITTRGFKYLFRMAETTTMRVQAQVDFIKEMEKQSGTEVKNFAIVYENTAYGQGAAKAQKELLPKNGFKIVLDEPYDPKAADLSAVVSKVKDAKPDVVLLASSAMPTSVMLVKGFKEQKVQPKAFFGTSAAFTDPDFLKNAGDAALGLFDISAWEPDVNRPFSKEAAKKFFDKYGVIMNNETAKDYVGMYVVKDVLERAASLDSEKLREAFASTNITQGVPQMYAKTVHFDQTGTFPDTNSIVLVQFRNVNGKAERVTVGPADTAREGFKPAFPYTYDGK